jgi:hypothetical protein
MGGCGRGQRERVAEAAEMEAEMLRWREELERKRKEEEARFLRYASRSTPHWAPTGLRSATRHHLFLCLSSGGSGGSRRGAR